MTPKQRQEAIRLYRDKKMKVRFIAAKYNVSPQHIYFLLKPMEQQKFLNKKRALMKKLRDGA